MDAKPKTLTTGWAGPRRSKSKKKKEAAAAAAAAINDAIQFGAEPTGGEMVSSRSGRMRKVVKYGSKEQEVQMVQKGGFHRTPEEAAHLQMLKDKYKDLKGFYPTGGQASSVKWLTTKITEMENEKAAGGSIADMDEDRARLDRELEREQKVEQRRLEKEAKEMQRLMVMEDQRKIREHKQREKEERAAEKMWTDEDDLSLAKAIGRIFYTRYGRHGSWPDVPAGMSTSRSHDSCRHRWNVLKNQPNIEAAVQAAAREEEESLRKKAEEAGEVLVERSPLGPERVNSPKAGAPAQLFGDDGAALRQLGGTACNRCKRLKRKCDGGSPCLACVEKNLGHECSYDHPGDRPSPVNVPEYDRDARDSCRICKGAVGVCRKWNAPGHLLDPTKPLNYSDMASPTRVFASYDSGGASPNQGMDWAAAEDAKLRDAVAKIGTSDWNAVSEIVGNARPPQACRGRFRRLAAAGDKQLAAAVRPVSAQQTLARLAGGFRWQGLKLPRMLDETDDYWKTYWAEAAKKQE